MDPDVNEAFGYHDLMSERRNLERARAEVACAEAGGCPWPWVTNARELQQELECARSEVEYYEFAMTTESQMELERRGLIPDQ